MRTVQRPEGAREKSEPKNQTIQQAHKRGKKKVTQTGATSDKQNEQQIKQHNVKQDKHK